MRLSPKNNDDSAGELKNNEAPAKAEDNELGKMTDFEYEQPNDNIPEIEMDFGPHTFTEAELDELVVNGQWLQRISARRLGRTKHYDKSLQKAQKSKMAKGYQQSE